MIFEGKEVDWAEEFNGAVTVCDKDGIIVYMNQYSIRQFKKYGGKKLLGTNLLDCYPEPSKTKIKKILKVDYLRGRAREHLPTGRQVTPPYISAKKPKIEFSLFHLTVCLSTDISPKI